MELRLTRPTTVAGALTPFKQALADLQHVLSLKEKACKAADAAIATSTTARETAIKTANARHDGVVSGQGSIKSAAEAEITEANAVIGKLGKLLDPTDDE